MAHHPGVLHIVAVLIIVGGISPAAIHSLPRFVRWLVTNSALFGRESARAFGRKIAVSSVYKAVAVTGAGLLERLSSKPSSTAAPQGKESLNRRMLLHALDRRTEPSVFVNTKGDLLATNRAAMDRLASSQAAAIITALSKLGHEGQCPDPAIESATRVEDTELWFCVLRSETP